MDTESTEEFRHLERHGGAATELELYVEATRELAATIEASGLTGLSAALVADNFGIDDAIAHFNGLEGAERIRVFAEKLAARGDLSEDAQERLKVIQPFAARLTPQKTRILNFVHGEKLRELAGYLDAGELWLRELSFYAGEYSLDRYSLETFVDRLNDFIEASLAKLNETGGAPALFELLKPMNGSAISERLAGRSARFSELIEALKKYSKALRGLLV